MKAILFATAAVLLIGGNAYAPIFSGQAYALSVIANR
jgi:hypothetical protein